MGFAALAESEREEKGRGLESLWPELLKLSIYKTVINFTAFIQLLKQI